MLARPVRNAQELQPLHCSCAQYSPTLSGYLVIMAAHQPRHCTVGWPSYCSFLAAAAAAAVTAVSHSGVDAGLGSGRVSNSGISGRLSGESAGLAAGLAATAS